MTVDVRQPRVVEIAALFDVAGGEDDAICDLTAGIDRLKRARLAKAQLAQLEVEELRAALRVRHEALGGDCA